MQALAPPNEARECVSTPVPSGDRWWHWTAGICAPLFTPHPDPVAKRPLVLRGVPGPARSGVSAPAWACRRRARSHGHRNGLQLPGGGPQKGGPPSRWRALATPTPRRQRSVAGGAPGGANACRSTFPPPPWRRNLPPAATTRGGGASASAGAPRPPAPGPGFHPAPPAAAIPAAGCDLGWISTPSPAAPISIPCWPC